MRLRVFIVFLVLLFTSLAAIPVFSQFRDFRKATMIKSNGDSIVGKISYKFNFSKQKKVLFKSGRSKRWIPVSELKRLVLSDDGEVYTVITLDDSTRTRVLARTFIDGRVGLYKASGTYYLKRDTNFFELHDKPIKVVRSGADVITHSRKYLNALHIAFADCQTLDYEPLAQGIRQKALTKLIYQYGLCKNIAVRSVDRGPTFEISLSAGPSALNLKSPYIEGVAYNSGKGFSYSLSFLRNFDSSNRFKIRVDLNYLKSDIQGAFTSTYTPPFSSSGARTEYVTFSTAYKGLRIPMGLQYHFFNNTSSLYLSGGICISINTYDDFDARRYLVYQQNDDTYVPFFQGHFDVTQNPVSGYWGAVGGDIQVNRRLKLNIELRAIKTLFNIAAVSKDPDPIQEIKRVTINELNSSFGLKYRIQ